MGAVRADLSEVPGTRGRDWGLGRENISCEGLKRGSRVQKVDVHVVGVW